MAVKLKGPANHGGFGFRGVSFAPDENGNIDVPHQALEEAFNHGFSLADEQASGEQDDEAKATKKKKPA